MRIGRVRLIVGLIQITRRTHLLGLLILLGLLVSHGSTVAAQAQDGADPPIHPQLRPVTAHMSWMQRDGAPIHIASLTQTTDGYLWIGSPLGLYRFDGTQFVAYPATALDTPLPSADVESLAADQNNGLWIGFRLGGMSHLAADGMLTNYNRRNGNGPGEVQKLLCRSDGSVWALGDGRLMQLKKGRWQNFGLDHGLPNDELYTFYFARNGDLWTAARKRVFVLRNSEAKFAPYPMSSFAVVDFAENSDGQLWVSDAWNSVHPLQAAHGGSAIATLGLARIVIEPSGTIWMAQDYRGVSHGSELQPGNVIKESSVSEQTEAILRDRDGNIWVGSSLGLDRYHATVLQNLSDIRLEYYPSLAADPRGGVWVATHQHPLLHVDAQGPVPIGHSVGSSPIVSDQAGSAWLVDPVLHNLVHYSQARIARVSNPKESNFMVAQSIGLDLDESPLVDYLTKGLWRYDGRWTRLHDPTLHDEDVLSMLRESQERVWLGFADGRIVQRDSAGFHEYPATPSSDVGNVLAFALLQGRVWAGGTNGVAYFDGTGFRRITLKNGFALSGVSGMVEDLEHNLWLNAQGGIVRINHDEVQKAIQHQETTLTYDVLDERKGLAGSATQLKPTPSAVAENDGTLVFATDGHVFFLDPAKVSFHSSTPSTLVQTVSLNGAVVIDREHSRPQIRVSSGSLNSLEVDYVGLDLTSPGKTQYQYMLEGEDRAWQHAGFRRQAFYSHLPPGTYRFRVRAGSEDNAMAESPLPIVLIVTPMFYQTTWFLALACVSVIAILYLVYLTRLQYVTNQLKRRMKERSGERTRVAREVHDTLLQSIHGLILRFHFATEALPADEPARESLQGALSRADDVIVEGRRRVEDLRDDIADVQDLASRLLVVGMEIGIQDVMAFKVNEKGKRVELNASVQTELCEIAHDVLVSIVDRSLATSALIALNYSDLELVMICGENEVVSSPVRRLHVAVNDPPALAGIRERVAALQGKMQLWTSPAGETQIEIRIPARVAYRWRGRKARLLEVLARIRRSS